MEWGSGLPGEFSLDPAGTLVYSDGRYSGHINHCPKLNPGFMSGGAGPGFFLLANAHHHLVAGSFICHVRTFGSNHSNSAGQVKQESSVGIFRYRSSCTAGQFLNYLMDRMS